MYLLVISVALLYVQRHAFTVRGAAA